LLFEANGLDNGHMVMDFGLMKDNIKDIIMSFNNSVTFWNKDDNEYINAVKGNRWVSLPVNPSAEQLSRVLFLLVNTILKKTQFANGECSPLLNSVIVHETETGYAQCFNDDVSNTKMGELNFKDIIFSEAIQASWKDKDLYNNISGSNEIYFYNNAPVKQV
jgi:6-pyruvoyltetrahydropterin/6-carboxytetrahydropterin synthase